jgi:hypothetical protein
VYLLLQLQVVQSHPVKLLLLLLMAPVLLLLLPAPLLLLLLLLVVAPLLLLLLPAPLPQQHPSQQCLPQPASVHLLPQLQVLLWCQRQLPS